MPAETCWILSVGNAGNENPCLGLAEAVGGGYLVATNIFIREAGAWKMVHHQAGPTPPPTIEASDDAVPAVH